MGTLKFMQRKVLEMGSSLYGGLVRQLVLGSFTRDFARRMDGGSESGVVSLSLSLSVGSLMVGLRGALLLETLKFM